MALILPRQGWIAQDQTRRPRARRATGSLSDGLALLAEHPDVGHGAA
ncbi:hypothetical protein [Cellulomonas dongxiuzhuiae]|uniref:Uncharacterized protein n=1 Tax=Cellulomonas dongxiuzhuiae TaxID=2819979 RepID=A0ABX8GIS4_9CELL|nr:hypothetical protein [Cellulomonas dongxiuzhuiae]MBO3089344.1 hypothetical protein [Cellulomonas dongxiuzhuiae]MBO3094870.1 hypothetical protein [Cellulomonas dongxiuzhuiae]QWC15900.1 hypothetical protein KKR89_16860 [Cellulomonas dongxiuzhuiae]